MTPDSVFRVRSRVVLLAVPTVWMLAGSGGSADQDAAANSPPTVTTTASSHAGDATMRKLTPVLMVEEIEPCLPFWTDRLGFEVTGTVPHGDRLGFAMLSNGDVEIMYQTRASMEEDVPGLADWPAGSAILFVEVGDVDVLEEALSDLEKLVPRRTTEYGAIEVGVVEPGGNAVIFAQFGTAG